MLRKGFTLIELLIVIAIMGIAMMVAMPNFSAINHTQAAVAAQDAIQLMKYARNMAILNQTPIDVEFASDGTLRVSAQQMQAVNSIANTSETGNASTAQELLERDQSDAGEDEPIDAFSKPSSSQKEGVVLSALDEISIEKRHRGIAFTFVDYLDDFDQMHPRKKHTSRYASAKRSPPDGVTDFEVEAKLTGHKRSGSGFKVSLKSNGTCRPFSIRIHDHEGDEGGIVIQFDLLATGKVTNDD